MGGTGEIGVHFANFDVRQRHCEAVGHDPAQIQNGDDATSAPYSCDYTNNTIYDLYGYSIYSPSERLP